MKPLAIAFAISLASLAIATAEEKQELPARDIGHKLTITGDLGVPVGHAVTITGRKVDALPLRNQFHVTAIDGRKINVQIEVPGIDHWPAGTEATLEGSEIGTLKFLTLKETNYGENDPRWKGPHQKLSLHFKVTRIISPAPLQLRER